MAKSIITAKQFASNSATGVIQARPIGGRVLLSGIYNFDADPSVRYEERQIQNSDRSYLQVEVRSDHGWVDLAQLMKRTKANKESASLDYVNAWIQEYADVAELAMALAGNRLVVSSNKVETYSTYKEGQTVDPYVNGVAYKAELQKLEKPAYTEPRPSDTSADLSKKG